MSSRNLRCHSKFFVFKAVFTVLFGTIKPSEIIKMILYIQIGSHRKFDGPSVIIWSLVECQFKNKFVLFSGKYYNVLNKLNYLESKKVEIISYSKLKLLTPRTFQNFLKCHTHNLISAFTIWDQMQTFFCFWVLLQTPYTIWRLYLASK